MPQKNEQINKRIQAFIFQSYQAKKQT